MRVMITGASGQVGSALRRTKASGLEVRELTHHDLDIADPAAVADVVHDFVPQIIINAAAYTAVDRAEEEPELAMRVNAHGPAALARAARGLPGCRLLHLSTDYVFDGSASRPYRPQDPTHPLNVYGHSKLAGEQAASEELRERCVILRTAWVYAPEGRNFLLTMLKLMRDKGAVRVVADQHGTPTTADSIAQTLWAIVSRPDVHGILHWTDAGSDTWFGFASAIAEEAYTAALLSSRPQVHPITSADFPTRARRPANSVLDIEATIATLKIPQVHWRANLRATLSELAAAQSRQS